MDFNHKNENKRILLAVFLSVLIISSWNYIFPTKIPDIKNSSNNQTTLASNNLSAQNTINNIKINTTISEDKIEIKKLTLQNDNIFVILDQNSGKILELNLKNYKDKEGQSIVLLNNEISSFADFNILLNNNEQKILKSFGKNFAILEYKNDNYIHTIKIELDQNFMLKISQNIKNLSKNLISTTAYGRINKKINKPDTYSNIITLFNKKIQEISYSKLKKLENLEVNNSTNSWLGFREQYWLTGLISNENNLNYNARYIKDFDNYQIYISKNITLNQGEEQDFDIMLFAGAKQIDLLTEYSKEFNINKFDKAIDFGFFYFISKPLLILINKLYYLTGNFAIAIIIMTILVRLIMLPLAAKSYKSMAKMKNISPRLKKLQEEYKDDKVTLQKEIMRVYKEEGVNPFAAFIPILFQIPIFFAFYKVLIISLEMRGAPMFGWIKDLSEPDPTSIFNLFGLLPFTVPQILHIGILPIIMGITMWLQQKFSPSPSMGNKDQERVMKMMPLIFVAMCGSFPAGLILYWIISNIFSILQQFFLNKINDN